MTFPNHWTIVTGLYPGFNGRLLIVNFYLLIKKSFKLKFFIGIVGNTVYDPDLDIKMNLLSGPGNLEVVWWNTTDPIWLTAKEQVFFCYLKCKYLM